MVLCLGSTLQVSGFPWGALLPWQILMPVLTLWLASWRWWRVPKSEALLVAMWVGGLGVSSLVALMRNADALEVAKGASLVWTDIVLTGLALVASSRQFRVIVLAVSVGLSLSLVLGLLECLELWRFAGSSQVLGAGSSDLPARFRDWAASAPAAGWGNPNNFAANQAVLASIALQTAPYGSLMLVPITFVVAKTESLLAEIGLVIAVVGTWWRPVGPRAHLSTRGALLAVGAIVTLLLLGDPASSLRIRADEVVAGDDKRMQLLFLSADALTPGSWIGAGPGFGYEWMEATATKRDVDYHSDPHNQFASAFIETGLMGGIGFAGLMTLAVVRASRSRTGGLLRRDRSRRTAGFRLARVLAFVLPVTFCASSSSTPVWPLWLALGIAIRGTRPSSPRSGEATWL